MVVNMNSLTWCRVHAPRRLRLESDEVVESKMRNAYELWRDTKPAEMSCTKKRLSALDVIYSIAIVLLEPGCSISDVQSCVTNNSCVNNTVVDNDTIRFDCIVDEEVIAIVVSKDDTEIHVKGVENLLISVIKEMQEEQACVSDLYKLAVVLDTVYVDYQKISKLLNDCGVSVSAIALKYFTQHNVQAMLKTFNVYYKDKEPLMSWCVIVKTVTEFLTELCAENEYGITTFEEALLSVDVGFVAGARAIHKYVSTIVEPEEDICIWTGYADLHNYKVGKLRLWFNPFIAKTKISAGGLKYNNAENTLLEAMYFDEYLSNNLSMTMVLKYISEIAKYDKTILKCLNRLQNIIDILSV